MSVASPPQSTAVPDQVQPEDLASDENDSVSGSDELSTYSTSLNATVYNYVHRHGRTYNSYKEGRYILPNDEQELSRLDIHHHLILKAMQNKLYFIPLPADFGGRALDVGTGTVLGNDLSLSMAEMILPNVNFYVDDIEAARTFPDHEKFDFIHGRFLASTIADWPKLMSQVYANTNAGGWIEFQDWNTFLYSQDDTLPADSALAKLHSISCYGREAQGYSMKPGAHLEQWIKDAGFVDVQVRKIFLPLGSWPKDPHLKELGMINYAQMQKGLEAMCYAILPNLLPEAGGPWKMEDIQTFLTQIRADMQSKKIHSVYGFYVVWGRKPES